MTRVLFGVPSTISAQPGRILVGTASWSDPGFVERWYPPKLPASDRLPWYAQHFEMVEVNSTFYAVPQLNLVARWCQATPNDFVFNIKLHRLLSRHSTTIKSLPPGLQRVAKADRKGRVRLETDLERALLDHVIAAIEPLRVAGKFGAFLLQLSPSFSPRKHVLSELDQLLEMINPLGAVVELRNRNWTEGEELERTLAFFRSRQTALALVDAPDEAHFMIMPSTLDCVTDRRRAYLRLHGRNAEAYLHGKTVAERFYYDYSDEEIDEVAQRAKKLASEADKVHIIFNNNALDFAPHAALRLRAALGQIRQGPPRQTDFFR